MSKIALGTVQFGIDYGINSKPGQVTSVEVKRILDYAQSSDIDILDTAPAYGDSEKQLGNYDLSNFNLTSKTRHFQGVNIGENELNLFRQDFDLTLKHLKQEKIYGLLVHNSKDLLKSGSDKLFGELQELKLNGKIHKIGVSVYDPIELDSVLSRFDLDIVQLPFNILDRRMLESGMLNSLYKKNIEIHSRSVFLQGLLLAEPDLQLEQFNQWKDLWKLWQEWLEDNKISALEATIRYVLGTEEISRVLVGVDSEIQLKEIIAASYGDLPNLPSSLTTDDTNLLNPSNWKNL
tara:strand:+ start:842 stop:1717 length:876 start_codon:yes stop_codon:yes gene_type:complete